MIYFYLFWFFISLGAPAIAQNRMPEIPADKLTDAQKKAAEEFAARRGKAPGHTGSSLGPFVPLLRSPEVFLSAETMGQYLQFKTALPPKLREFVILITGRQLTQETIWNSHVQIAVKAGLGPEILKALAEGQRPPGMSDDEEIVYDFCDELHRNQSVSDTTYTRAWLRFNEQGVIDMVSVNGYYTFLAMVMNVARTPPPPYPKAPLPNLVAFPH
jgi:4-carboxymuconolactone decarboxylase